MKNILQENMRRFGTKNLLEQSVPNTLSDDDILDIILTYTDDPDLAEEQLMAYRETGEFSNNEIEANVLRDPRWTTVNNDELTLVGPNEDENLNIDVVNRSLNLLDKAADMAIKNPKGNIVALGNIIKQYVNDIRKSL
jgi:hypothetical protein